MFDPDTIEGDYREAYHHANQMWKKAKIDHVFSDEYFSKDYKSPAWEEYKRKFIKKLERQESNDSI